jgi:hypothetical protein
MTLVRLARSAAAQVVEEAPAEFLRSQHVKLASGKLDG